MGAKRLELLALTLLVLEVSHRLENNRGKIPGNFLAYAIPPSPERQATAHVLHVS